MSSSSVSDSPRPDGFFASGSDKKAKIFNTFFVNIFTAGDATDPHFPARVAQHVRLAFIDFSPAMYRPYIKL